jgi:hypothetical protein
MFLLGHVVRLYLLFEGNSFVKGLEVVCEVGCYPI